MKKIIFNKELTENERKTLSVLIEIENGVPKLTTKRLKDIYAQTKITRNQQDIKRETHRGYQHKVLRDLQRKGIVDSKEKGCYFIKKKYIDIAFNSFIQNKIKNLEEKGLFTFRNASIFGIKKNWSVYPEIVYLYETIHESLPMLYRIKQLKAICMVRDFSKQWKTFLVSDVPPEVKYWMWWCIDKTLFICYKKIEGTIDNDLTEKGNIDIYIKLFELFGIPEEKIKNFKTLLVRQHKDNLVELRKQRNYKPYDSTSQDPVWKKKEDEYLAAYDKFVQNYIEKELTEKQKKIIEETTVRFFEICSNEINNLGIYVDLGKQTRDLCYHMEIPTDDEQKFCARIFNGSTLRRMEENIKDLKIETIDKVMKNSYDIYSNQITDCLTERLYAIVINQITKPEKAVFPFSPELKRMAKELMELEKQGKYDGSKDLDVRYEEYVRTALDKFKKGELPIRK